MAAYVATAKKNWPLIIWGIISLIIGVLLLFIPRLMAVANLVIGIWVGVTFIIDGIFHVSNYIAGNKNTGSSILSLILGFLIILIGLLCIVRPILGIGILGLIMSIAFIVIGIAAIAHCVSMYRVGFPHWWIMIIVAIIFIFAGILLLFNSDAWGVLLPILAGIHFIVDGIGFILSGAGKEVSI